MVETNHVSSEPFILFELAGTTYGVHSHAVKQMEMVEQITPVPNAPPAVEGVVFSRGQVIPTVDLRTRFGFPRIPHDLHTRLIVVQTAGRTVGFIVDAAREFVSIPTEAIQPPADTISAQSGRYLEGVATLGDRLVLILKIEQILDLEALPSL
jgi:purine-binding chemotaxis protein CheW